MVMFIFSFNFIFHYQIQDIFNPGRVYTI